MCLGKVPMSAVPLATLSAVTNPVPVQLREALDAARRAGVDFEAAWAVALNDISGEWLEVFRAHEPHWRDAYERLPATRRLRAVRVVASDEDADLELVPIGAGFCRRCEQPLPPPHSKQGRERLYCSDRCRRAASRPRRKQKQKAAA